ncbi:hypothetical protein E7811_16690 [Aliigemmobacter aestuarii]|uniref:Bacteriophage CI repressor N-terminal domain-containing protein n=1 Tax=Aliigemmobacter aestuarii TaxID=1445661 RepID=A0A4S3MKR8_9RHOB|nr:helix-turn-helix domain-containing protein [Gemmobacter aestuarii]THD81542.1 hypothetical protein E7811_16690 [Gemmobacter aestuarii]
MIHDWDIIIDKLKARYLVDTDQELARALKLGRSTVATWRNRGSVPAKYVEIANSADTRKFYGETPWDQWAPLEKAAMQLALMRLMRDKRPMLDDYTAFVRLGQELGTALAEEHGRAAHEIASVMADNEIEQPTRALDLIVAKEFFGAK